MSFKITDLEHNHGLMKIIKEQGKSLLDLKLLIANQGFVILNFYCNKNAIIANIQ